jgi:hypothetical protein
VGLRIFGPGQQKTLNALERNMKSNLLRRIAAHFLGCELNADIRVMYRWTRPEDDVRAVRLETRVNGETKRVTLYRHTPGCWSAMAI